jgi:hypothetical protein
VVHLRVNKVRLTPDGTGVVLGSGSFKGPREDARVTEDAWGVVVGCGIFVDDPSVARNLDGEEREKRKEGSEKWRESVKEQASPTLSKIHGSRD